MTLAKCENKIEGKGCLAQTRTSACLFEKQLNFPSPMEKLKLITIHQICHLFFDLP